MTTRTTSANVSELSRVVAITSISKSYTAKETVRSVAALILSIKNAVADTVNYISILQSGK
jgi:hypothetical protein